MILLLVLLTRSVKREGRRVFGVVRRTERVYYNAEPVDRVSSTQHYGATWFITPATFH